ncbi:gliding motility-associated C-terminal domain-containing protein [Marinifilum sp. RC60d5]|uniref:T9SS type B sorting domain-containing protein n=1 Tax=Marinifilum sp. RC60d5 TaxID=3458414 RepID=UPI0040355CD1
MRIFLILIGILLPNLLFSQTEEVKIKSNHQVMYCSANNGIALPEQEIRIQIEGPENKKWFVSYSINNSPTMVLYSKNAVQLSKYNLSLLLKNYSGKIKNYTIELKKAWFEDFTPINIAKGYESTTIQILPLPSPEVEDYYPKAKSKSKQDYTALIGKYSTYSVLLPEGAKLLDKKNNESSDKQRIELTVEWPEEEGAHILKLIETDAFGCNSDTIFAGIEIVKKFNVDLGETKHICKGDSITLRAQIDLPSQYSYQWSTNETSDSIIVSKEGNYTVSVTDLNDNQTISTNVDIIVHEPPEINIADRIIIDKNNSVIDIYSEGCSYLWSDGSTESSNQFLKTGEYSVVKTSDFGCSNTKSFKTKTQEDLFTLYLPDILHMCGEEKTSLSPKLSINQTYTFKWNNGSTNESIPIEKEGNYILTVSDSDGFEKTDSTRVIYHANPIIDLGEDLVLWEGETAVLDAKNSGADYTWSNGENSQKITINSGGNFTVEVSDQYGCSNKDTIYVDYKNGQKFGVFIGEDQSICKGDSVLITVQIEGNPTYPLNYNWADLKQNTPEIYLTKSGTQCLEVSDANGNIESDCLDIKMLSIPIINLGKDFISYPNDGIILDAGNPGCFYTWSTGEISQKISINTEGKYWVKVNNEFNCSAQDTIEVGFAKDYPFVGLPKAFTPNGDGHNDKLFIRGTDFKEAHLIIYNRLGHKLFETKSINKGWDGFYKGELQNIDVYIYVLEVIYLDNRKILKKGNVSLLR